MSSNIGVIDRTLRIIVGVLLIGFAAGYAFPQTGWNWLGWIGVVPLVTAIVGVCPLYSVLGLSTRAEPAGGPRHRAF
jgi:apolipoprotein N-acyltransferase